MSKNDLIRRSRLVSKFMMSETGQQIVTIYILPNISRSKDTQTMKIDQLIEYNMRKVSSKIIHKEAIPRPFYKK